MSDQTPTLSPDGRWWWDGQRWRPVAPANVNQLRQDSTGRWRSGDGRQWWDGQQWHRVPAAPENTGHVFLHLGIAGLASGVLFTVLTWVYWTYGMTAYDRTFGGDIFLYPVFWDYFAGPAGLAFIILGLVQLVKRRRWLQEWGEK